MGKFIVVEGIDGSGKTTLVKNLAERLRGDGLRVHTTFEPTKNVIGSMVRSRLNEKNGSGDDVHKWLEFELLLAADRMHHLHSEVRPRLLDHDVVLCDRYIGSGYAYGVACRPRSMSWGEAFGMLRTLYQYALMPDHTLFVDLPVDDAMGRMAARGGEQSRYDGDKDFLIATSNEYDSLCVRLSWESIDASNKTKEHLSEEAHLILSRHLR